MNARLTGHLVWTLVGAPPAGRMSLTAGIAPRAGAEDLAIDTTLTPRDTAIYLLNIGAQIEHLLMVQYLYAGYSLGGPHLNDSQNRTVAPWHKTVLAIAREEMAQLVLH